MIRIPPKLFYERQQPGQISRTMVIERPALEDELGDVLDKAIRMHDRTEADIAASAGIAEDRLHTIIDYGDEHLDPSELARLAAVLELNPRGLAALASDHYPLPQISGLPFCLYPLRMTHGIGVANAYLVADCCADSGILFDTGTGEEALWRVWPRKIKRLSAVFITHGETEHCGGLAAVRRRFPDVPVFGPATTVAGAPLRMVSLSDGAKIEESGFAITTRATPGHAEGHHCYLVTVPNAPHGPVLAVTGDLLFAGSIGGAFYCRDRLRRSVAGLFRDLPEDTVIAPGHGPLTTIANERRFNPFVVRENTA